MGFGTALFIKKQKDLLNSLCEKDKDYVVSLLVNREVSILFSMNPEDRKKTLISENIDSTLVNKLANELFYESRKNNWTTLINNDYSSFLEVLNPILEFLVLDENPEISNNEFILKEKRH